MNKRPFVLMPTPIEDYETCQFCGRVGRITVNPSKEQEAWGFEPIQTCRPCLAKHDSTDQNSLWETYWHHIGTQITFDDEEPETDEDPGIRTTIAREEY